MTEEERAVWEQRCMRFQETLAGNPPPSLKTRLDWLEADSAAQRTAILKLEREVRWHRVALWILSGFVYLWTLWRLFL
jgi:hypothetical protein